MVHKWKNSPVLDCNATTTLLNLRRDSGEQIKIPVVAERQSSVKLDNLFATLGHNTCYRKVQKVMTNLDLFLFKMKNKPKNTIIKNLMVKILNTNQMKGPFGHLASCIFPS